MITQSLESPPLSIPGYRSIQDRQQICRLEGYGNYTFIHLKASPKPLIATQTLKHFESQLPGFIRVSKSSLINPAHVVEVIKQVDKTVLLLFTNGVRILVSRRRIDDTLAQLASFSPELSLS